MWRSLVARLVRDQEVVGSNPIIPTMTQREGDEYHLFLFKLIYSSYRYNKGDDLFNRDRQYVDLDGA